MSEHSILVVDDDSNITWFFKNVLEREGFHVDTAFRGEQAIKLAKEKKFDLAILDIVLPDIRGDQLAYKLDEVISRLKIIFVSGYSQIMEDEDHSRLNILQVLEKPIMYQQLIKATKDALFTEEAG